MKYSLAIILVWVIIYPACSQSDITGVDEFFPVDAGHSYVGFSIKYMGLAKVRGRFASFGGLVCYNPESMSKTSVTMVIQSASIDTDLDFRDNDLKSENWFDVAKYPAIRFQSTRTAKSDRGMDMWGNLTIKGTTKEIAIHMDAPSPVMKDVRGDTQVMFAGSLVLNRKDFGVEGKNWSTVKEGMTAVAEEVEIEISILGKITRAANFSNRLKDDTQPPTRIYRLVKERGTAAAIDEFRKLGPSANVSVLRTVGTMLRLEGNLTDALKILTENKSAFPKESAASFSLGMLYLQQENYKSARTEFEETLLLDKDNIDAEEILRHLK